MPGSNAGTGEPNWFACAIERRERSLWGLWKLPNMQHKVRRTGRERPYSPRGQSIRTDHVAREYVCETCGHRGWSAHKDLGNPNWYPIVEEGAA